MLRADNYQEYKKFTYKEIMNGKPLWIEHQNEEQIDKKKREYIAKGLGYQYYREFMNDPVSDENQKFRPEMMKFFKEVTLEGKMLANTMALDRAYSTEKTADFTGITIVSVDRDNNWYVRLAERFKGDEKQLIDRIFELQAAFNVDKTGIEQKAFEYTLKGYIDDEMRRRNQFFKIEGLKDLGKSKTLRIEGLIPRYVSGSIYFKEDQLYLREELERFPRGEFDDLADSLAYQLVLAEIPRQTVSQARTDIKEQENFTYEEWG